MPKKEIRFVLLKQELEYSPQLYEFLHEEGLPFSGGNSVIHIDERWWYDDYLNLTWNLQRQEQFASKGIHSEVRIVMLV
jgi:hypothetical protein